MAERGGERGRERQREAEKGRERQREVQREAERGRERCRERQREAERGRVRQREAERSRERDNNPHDPKLKGLNLKITQKSQHNNTKQTYGRNT